MKIHNKLFAVFIIFAAALVSSLVGLTQWSINKGMVDYVNQREINALKPMRGLLVQRYLAEGNWLSLKFNHREFEYLLHQSLQETEFLPPRKESRPPPRDHHRKGGDRRRPPRGEKKRPLKHSDSPKIKERHRNNRSEKRPPPRERPVSYALLDVDKSYIVGDYPAKREYSFTPLINDDNVIGFLAISKRNRLTQGYEFDFVEQQKDYLWLIGAAVMILVLLITLPFSRHLVAPLSALTKGMHQLTQGQYKSRLTNTRKDEFSQLTRDFNELAKTLMENDSARKRWLANISHELRTPVAILKGELEAVLDGVRALSIEHVNSAHQEVTHLQRLIADLHALTSADIGGMSYRKQPLDLAAFIKNESVKLNSYLAKENFKLINEITVEKAFVYADATRLCQLCENIINNCIKYATTGTKVCISLNIHQENNQAILCIEDDGVGVAEQHLVLLFEHLYRVEDSRNRKTGGSGLGLSICAHIVQAHQGEIMAKKSKLGGLAIHICLPLL